MNAEQYNDSILIRINKIREAEEKQEKLNIELTKLLSGLELGWTLSKEDRKFITDSLSSVKDRLPKFRNDWVVSFFNQHAGKENKEYVELFGVVPTNGLTDRREQDLRHWIGMHTRTLMKTEEIILTMQEVVVKKTLFIGD